MDDYKFVLYGIGFVLFILFRVYAASQKKKKQEEYARKVAENRKRQQQPSATRTAPTQQRTSQPQGQQSIEDIFKEIYSDINQEKEVQQAPQPVQQIQRQPVRSKQVDYKKKAKDAKTRLIESRTEVSEAMKFDYSIKELDYNEANDGGADFEFDARQAIIGKIILDKRI